MSSVKTIFIVDDDATQSMMLQDYLSKFPNFTIYVFSTGEDCIKNLSLNPQVIFLDYYFDQATIANAMNGIRVLRKIKELKPNIEVVMFSGQDRIEVAVNSMKYGAFDYIVKSESAFHRSENVIFNIIKNFKLKRDASLYKKLFYVFSVTFVAVLIVLVILYKMGKITDQPIFY